MRDATLFVLISILGGFSYAAETHRDDARRFQFIVPEGWLALTPTELKKLNESTAEAAALAKKPASVCIAGYSLKALPLGDGPMLLVQDTAIPTAGASHEEIEKELLALLGKKELKHIEELPEEIRNVAAESVVYDRTRNRFAATMRIPEVDGIVSYVHLVGHIGSGRLVRILATMPESQWGKYQPVIDSMNDSFRFDTGAEFKPVALAPLYETATLDDSTRKMIRIGGFGLFLCLLIGVELRWRLRKKKQAVQEFRISR